jgi:hypothetical protein
VVLRELIIQIFVRPGDPVSLIYILQTVALIVYSPFR